MSKTTSALIAILSLLLPLVAGGCKERSRAKRVYPPPAARKRAVTALPATVAQSCSLVCARQTTCLRTPQYRGQCTRVCVAQARLPIQKKRLLAAHHRVIKECFGVSCQRFDRCFKRVVFDQMAKIGKAIGASAKITISAKARAAFKKLFCEVARASGGMLPDLASPNPPPKIKRLKKFMRLLVRAPKLLRKLLREAQLACRR